MRVPCKSLHVGFALLLAACSAMAEVPHVRVRLFSGSNMTQILLSGASMELVAYRGGESLMWERNAYQIRPGQGGVVVSVEGEADVAADSVAVSAAQPYYLVGARSTKRYLPGVVVIRPRSSAYLLAVNVLSMDDYLMGVVHAELGRLEHPQLWAAQAAVARTWFARNQRKFFDQGECYAVTDDVQSQVYHGWPVDSARRARLQAAVRETSGLVLVDEAGRGIEALFHANSGGQTMPSEWYFSPRGHLQSVPDSFSLNCPQTYWTKSLDKEAFLTQMARWLKASSSDSEFRSFVCSYQQPVRAEYLNYQGQKIRLRTIREHYKLRSTWFSIEDAGSTVVLRGRGYGHGIGLSQEGAHVMAQKGYSAAQIMAFYYPGTQLVPWEAMQP
ncbi:MAG: SpoIID/LytB domain-containing protein [Bacteroidetes bacterium]|nr:SpoIID/LytB domain-containing protein [Bacteroidota bacterium]MDA0828642.1 SpoIID/LytB domain-containing protein [Bacteroidota bacterium]MDA1199665.1 SpoIID/LytB domain-containing protein [Bacteroidota bacterium]